MKELPISVFFDTPAGEQYDVTLSNDGKVTLNCPDDYYSTTLSVQTQLGLYRLLVQAARMREPRLLPEPANENGKS